MNELEMTMERSSPVADGRTDPAAAEAAEAAIAKFERARRVVRCEAMQSLDRRLDNARHCAAWLIELGVKVRGVRVDKASGVVKVESTPFLWRLFAGDCAWRERRQKGAMTIFTWFAVRYSTRIEWEEQQWRG
jgi:hypothetical protein